jgi:outer membrane lipoprotein-sorting protein
MMRKALYLVIIALFYMLRCSALPAEDGAALLKRLDKNMNPQSYEFYRKIINIEPDGRKKEFVMYTVKKGYDKVAGIFLSPASEKGRSLLRLGDNYWLYIPNAGKPIRLTNVQSVTGGVFNNADILAIDYSAEYTVRKMEDKGATVTLDLKAKSGYVAYDRLRMDVDKKHELPLKIECRTEAGMLIKTLTFKDIKDFGAGIVRPSLIETDSPLQKGYKSIMLYREMKKKALPDEVFTLTFMPKMDTLIP